MDRREAVPRRARRARVAVDLLFFVNGALISNVLPRLPAIKSDLGLSNGQLGLAVATASFGALLAGPFASTAAARFGSARLAVVAGAVFGPVLVLVGLAGSWAALAAAFGLFGMLDVLMDVAMNAHGLRVQGLYGRSIFNIFHAWWSIGATVGGAVGAAAAALGVPVAVHLLGAGLALAVASLAAAPWLLPGPDHPHPQPREAQEAPGAAPAGGSRRLGLLLRVFAPFVVLSMTAAFVEDVPGSFGAVYLRDGLGATPGVSGLAWVGFVGGMTLGRLRADLLVDRYGAKAVLRAGNALAAVAMGVALLLGHPAAAIVGFTLVGVGACSTVPSLFVLAGRRGARPSDGIALVSWATRFGFMASPAVAGLVADAAGLPLAVALCPLAAAAIAVGAGFLPATGGAPPAGAART